MHQCRGDLEVKKNGRRSGHNRQPTIADLGFVRKNIPRVYFIDITAAYK